MRSAVHAPLPCWADAGAAPSATARAKKTANTVRILSFPLFGRITHNTDRAALPARGWNSSRRPRSQTNARRSAEINNLPFERRRSKYPSTLGRQHGLVAGEV